MKIKNIAKDWSHKLHLGENGTIAFDLQNYARKNYIKLKENTKDNVIDVGILKVNNEILKQENNLFEIDIESGINYPAPVKIKNSIDRIANIPLEMIDETGSRSFSGTKPHIVERTSQKFNYTNNSNLLKMYAVYHVPMQQIINKYYNKIQTCLLDRPSIIEAEFMLNDEDIETYDQFIPVYIEYFGAYFYVNKIKNYINGRLTKCELIRL